MSLSMPRLSPACDERVNAARKVVTELVDVSGHVVIVIETSSRRQAAAQPRQRLQRLRQGRERACRPLGVRRHAWQRTELRPYRLFGGELLLHQSLDALDRRGHSFG